MPAILYSFRRCPYAMRARMAIVQANIDVVLREVSLKAKPQQLLAVSPKATVPVLITEDSTIIEESLDIMLWALTHHDPNEWLNGFNDDGRALISENDTTFKAALDTYKYADRHPERTPEEHRQQCLPFLDKLEHRLSQHPFLMGDTQTLPDIAIFPFIRQFAGVDSDWFATCAYPLVRRWLTAGLNAQLFLTTMKKYLVWSPNDPEILFGKQN